MIRLYPDLDTFAGASDSTKTLIIHGSEHDENDTDDADYVDGHADDESGSYFVEETEWRQDCSTMPPSSERKLLANTTTRDSSRSTHRDEKPKSWSQERGRRNNDSANEVQRKTRKLRASSQEIRPASGIGKDSVSKRFSRSKSPTITSTHMKSRSEPPTTTKQSESLSPTKNNSKLSVRGKYKRWPSPSSPGPQQDQSQVVPELSEFGTALSQHSQDKPADRLANSHVAKRSSHKITFGNRFFSRMKVHKMHDASINSRASDRLSPYADLALRPPSSPETMARIIKELSIEVGDLRKRQLKSSHFEASVDRSTAMFRALHILHHCILRKQLLAKTRALYRWVQFTASWRSVEMTEDLYSRRKEENAKHAIAIKTILLEAERMCNDAKEKNKEMEMVGSNVILITRRNGKTRQVNVLQRNKTLELSMKHMQREILDLQSKNAKLKQQLHMRKGFTKNLRTLKSSKERKRNVSRQYQRTTPSSMQMKQIFQLVEESSDRSISALHHSSRKSMSVRARIMNRERNRQIGKIADHKSQGSNNGNRDQKRNESPPPMSIAKGSDLRTLNLEASGDYSMEINATPQTKMIRRSGRADEEGAMLHKRGGVQNMRTNNVRPVPTKKEEAQVMVDALRETRLEMTVNDYRSELRNVFIKHTSPVPSFENPHSSPHMSSSQWISMCRSLGIIGGHLSQRFIANIFDEFCQKQRMHHKKSSIRAFLDFDAFILALEKCAWQYALNREGRQSLNNPNRAGMHLALLLSIMEKHGCRFHAIKDYLRYLEEEPIDVAYTGIPSVCTDTSEGLTDMENSFFEETNEAVSENAKVLPDAKSSPPDLKSHLRQAILDDSDAGNGLREFLMYGISVPYTEFQTYLIEAAGASADPSQLAKFMLECDPLGEGIVSPNAVSDILQGKKPIPGFYGDGKAQDSKVSNEW